MLAMQEKNRNMRLQLLESQTLFKEVMEEAREIILASVEPDDYSTDDDRSVLGRGIATATVDMEAGASDAEDGWDAADAEAVVVDEVEAGRSDGEDADVAPREREWWEEAEASPGEDEAAVHAAEASGEEARSDGEEYWRESGATGSEEEGRESWRYSREAAREVPEEVQGDEAWRGAAAAAGDGYRSASDVDGGWRSDEESARQYDSEGGAADSGTESDRWSDESVWGSASEGERRWSDDEDEDRSSPSSPSAAVYDSEGNVHAAQPAAEGWRQRLEMLQGARQSGGERAVVADTQRRSTRDVMDSESAGEDGRRVSGSARWVGEATPASRPDVAKEQGVRGREAGRAFERADGEQERANLASERTDDEQPRWRSPGRDTRRPGSRERAPGSAAERLQVVGEVRGQALPQEDAAAERIEVSNGTHAARVAGESEDARPVQRPLVDEFLVREVPERGEEAPRVQRSGGGRRRVTRPRPDALERRVEQDSMRVPGPPRRGVRSGATRLPEVSKVLQKVPATEAAGALLEAQVRVETGLDGDSSGEDVQWLTEQAESLLSVRTPGSAAVNMCCAHLARSCVTASVAAPRFFNRVRQEPVCAFQRAQPGRPSVPLSCHHRAG